MRLLAFLIIASIILSLARALTLVLALILVASLLWAIMTRPLELLGFMTLMLMSEMISASPLATIVALAGIAALVVLRDPATTGGSLTPHDQTTRRKMEHNSD